MTEIGQVIQLGEGLSQPQAKCYPKLNQKPRVCGVTTMVTPGVTPWGNGLGNKYSNGLGNKRRNRLVTKGKPLHYQ